MLLDFAAVVGDLEMTLKYVISALTLLHSFLKQPGHCLDIPL